jgi:sorting nexin-9/18/33
MIPTMDGLKEYLGLIQEFPGTVDMHRGLVGKIRDCEKMKEEGRIDFMEASEMNARAEKVSTVVMAEINHFQRERVKDFRSIMKFMLEEQIKFYTNVSIT